ncbi:hypothetical protein CLV84_0276 [Neolewinella xylanilytica]|uniref:F5/8 type C domain-containing protein n=1 Tax=Neolewinella xylanilytica TaxID=1514080 RepID=A0A2S6I745_9BACT|nr:hypothetical protein [Neolewinella xylanilytica]PPK87336.1 hypothetical protein CLV84_0276 [Neolewinella xylanilytica]
MITLLNNRFSRPGIFTLFVALMLTTASHVHAQEAKESDRWQTSYDGELSPEKTLVASLISFGGEAQEKVNHLRWTAGNTNTAMYFSVERSKSGNAWEEVAVFKGGDASDAVTEYLFVDTNPAAITQYRLRMERNGAVSYLTEAVEVFRWNAVSEL